MYVYMYVCVTRDLDLLGGCYCTAIYWSTVPSYMSCKLLKFSYSFSSILKALINCNNCAAVRERVSSSSMMSLLRWLARRFVIVVQFGVRCSGRYSASDPSL